MMKRKLMVRPIYCPGNVLSEYGLLIASVSVLAMASLYMLRDSVAQLFTQVPVRAMDYNILAPVSNAPAASAAESDHTVAGRHHTLDPVTGLPSFITSGGSAPENATSVEGSEVTSVASWGHAQALEQLAQAEKNSDYASYYTELARISYYMGVAEGRLDGLEQFRSKEGTYEPDDALVDLINLQSQLREKLDSPPAGLTDTAIFKAALPLATDVAQIADQYRSAFNSQIGPDGKVSPFRISDTRERGPGTAFSVSSHIYAYDNPEFVGDFFGTTMMDYDTVKTIARQVVADTRTNAPLTKQTFNDAIDLDTVQSTSSGTPGT
jgi:hypothetical protein